MVFTLMLQKAQYPRDLTDLREEKKPSKNYSHYVHKEHIIVSNHSTDILNALIINYKWIYRKNSHDGHKNVWLTMIKRKHTNTVTKKLEEPKGYSQSFILNDRMRMRTTSCCTYIFIHRKYQDFSKKKYPLLIGLL